MHLSLTALAMMACAPPAAAIGRPVASTAALLTEVGRANPGDVITLQPGTYTVGSKVSVGRAGTAAAPIVVRAATPGTVVLRSSTVELFFVTVPYWRFENLTIEGICADDLACEHAFHIVGRASFTRLSNLILRDFNAAVKGNGDLAGGVVTFPSDVVIERSRLYNRRIRNTGNPATAIDVVGGDRWIVRDNTIADIAKSGGNQSPTKPSSRATVRTASSSATWSSAASGTAAASGSAYRSAAAAAGRTRSARAAAVPPSTTAAG